MYHSYFGLHEPPFSIAVNPRYLFMSERHRDALAHLLYGVGVGGGFILLTGEVGTGKTTINRCVLEQLPEHTDVALVLNPALNAEGLLAAICDELAIEYTERDQTLKGLTDKLHGFLLANHQRGRTTVLLIDEAQHLKPEVLEQIRLLTNLETSTKKLLQIILVGQPELKVTLQKPELRQLSQRITARYQLKPLTLAETRAYIQHRLQVAGLPANQELFPPRIVARIHRVSDGIPRLINVLCDRMLLGAYGQHKSRVDMAIFRQAVIEVKGEDDELSGSSHPRVAILAVLALLALVAAGGWWQFQERKATIAGGTAEVAAMQPESQQKPAAPAHKPMQPAQAESTPQAPASTLAGGPTPATVVPVGQDAAVVVEPVVEVTPVVSRPAFPLRQRNQALNDLLLFQGVLQHPVTDPCQVLAAEAWRCETLKVDSWARLLTINRPLILMLQTEGSGSSWVALVAVTGNSGIFLGENGPEELPLSALGEYWSGDVVLPWLAPPGFREFLRLGSRGPAVGWLSRGFATLDGQGRGLTDTVYNHLLEQRVKLFQGAENLQVDGVAGLATVMRLDQRLGNGQVLSRGLGAPAGLIEGVGPVEGADPGSDAGRGED